MTFVKYTRYFLYVIMGISVIFTILFYFGGVVPGTEESLVEPNVTDEFIKYAYILFIVAIIAVLGFSIYNIIGNTKNIKNLAVVLIIAAVIFLISRLIASDEVLKLETYKGTDNVPNVLKNVGTGIIATYILLGITILAIIYSEISKMFK